jgi:membrane associated rhomboid family serine protease
LSKSRLPIATLALIVVSLVAAFFTLTNPDSLLRWGHIPTPLGEPTPFHRFASALTSLFVHLDPLHLLGNMLVLAAVGPSVERAAGAWKLLVVFFIAGLLGVAAHHAASLIVLPAIAGDALAGSSGAIAGLIGYAWLRFHRARVPLLPSVWVPVWVVILVWLGLQVGGAWFSASQFGSSVAYFAHLVGFVAGFLLAFPLGASAAAADEAWQEHLAKATHRGTMATVAVLKNRSVEMGDAGALAELAANLESDGETEEATKVYARLLTESADHAALATTRLAVLRRLGSVSRPERLGVALGLGAEQREAAALILDSLVDEPADRLTPSALEALVETWCAVDLGSARSAARRLMADYALSPEADRVRSRYPDLGG